MGSWKPWADKTKTPAGKSYPKSVWDKAQPSPFGWSTPAPNMDGSYPEPWRTSYKDNALEFLNKLFYEYKGEIYTDFDTVGNHNAIVVGLRGRDPALRSLEARREVFTRMAYLLGSKGFNFKLISQTSNPTLYLVDDLDPHILSKKGTQRSNMKKLSRFEKEVIRLATKHPEIQKVVVAHFSKAAKEMYVEVKELPDAVQRALSRLGYHKAGIHVRPTTTYTVQKNVSFEANRGVTVLVDLSSGRTQENFGTFGGPTPGYRETPVDSDDRERPLPHNGAVIQGESGGRGTFLTVLIHPSNINSLMLPTHTERLTREQELALFAFKGLKSSARRDHFERRGLGDFSMSNPLIQALIEKGMIQKKGPGLQVTVKGIDYATQHNLREY